MSRLDGSPTTLRLWGVDQNLAAVSDVRAVRCVTRFARDAADRAHLLDVLGLTELAVAAPAGRGEDDTR